MKKNIILLTFIFSTTSSFSQVNDVQLKKELNNLRTGPIIASSPAERVGNGVIFWIINSNNDYTDADKIFSSCDGKIISYAFDSAISADENLSTRLTEIYSQIKTENFSQRTSTTSFINFEDIEIYYKEFIKKNIKDICSKAKPEKRGEQIPISDTVWSNDNTKTITSFLPGTFKRNGNQVEGWFRSYDILRKEHRKPDGSVQYLYNGKPFYLNLIKDKSYSMIKWSFDCKSDKSSINQLIKYNASGDVTNSNTFQIDFTDIVPNSVGEGILNNICKIY
jgi:hypothetical protein